MNISLFENIKKSKVIGLDTIDGIIEKIRNGETRTLTSIARTFGKHSPEYEKVKFQVPTFTPNASFNPCRNQKYLVEPSGFIYLDFDEFDDFNFLISDQFIYSAWKSLSGTGFGALVKVSGITAQNFKECWNYLSNYFKGYGIIVDPQTCDITRQNVISFDPDIYINKNASSLHTDHIISQTHTTIPQFQDANESSISGWLYDFDKEIYSDSAKIKYRSTLDDYQGKDYVIIEEGKESRTCYLPKEIPTGKRHQWMAGHTKSLLYLNPSITMEKLYNCVYRANLIHCNPPMLSTEIMSIVRWYFEKHSKGMLDYHPKLKKIWIDPSSDLSRHDKRKIIGEESGKLKRKSTSKILKSVYSELSKTNVNVTQKMVANASKRSLRTVKDYWNEIINQD